MSPRRLVPPRPSHRSASSTRRRPPRSALAAQLASSAASERLTPEGAGARAAPGKWRPPLPLRKETIFLSAARGFAAPWPRRPPARGLGPPPDERWDESALGCDPWPRPGTGAPCSRRRAGRARGLICGRSFTSLEGGHGTRRRTVLPWFLSQRVVVERQVRDAVSAGGKLSPLPLLCHLALSPKELTTF